MTAAENALHSCYYSCLVLLKEQVPLGDEGDKFIALPIINAEKQNYPRATGAHIAIRTVRRFLEKHGEVFSFSSFSIFVLRPTLVCVRGVELIFFFMKGGLRCFCSPK